MKSELAVALEELQDDVFESTREDYGRPERIKKSPRKSDKVYVQKKNKFELTSRPSVNGSILSGAPEQDRSLCKRLKYCLFTCLLFVNVTYSQLLFLLLL